MKKLFHFFWILNRPCRDMTEYMSRDMDQAALSASERFAYKFHMLYCRACRRYRRQVALLREAFRQLAQDWAAARPQVDVRLSADARSRIAAVLRRR
jgi:predicted anti-sigma-YlaC factor YlaD